MATVDLLLVRASQVVTLDGGEGPLAGKAAMNELGVIDDGAVAVQAGRIVDVGPTIELARRHRGFRRIGCRGRTILPGFVDAHTHPAFARMREDEFAMRCRGATYEDILAAGGGIHASAKRLRDEPPGRLVASIRRRLDRMLLHGTTVVEAKSGYGLETDAEIKSLRAIGEAARGHPVRVVRTFLGAHAMPPAYRDDRETYIREVIERMIPKVARQRLASFCDVFVEKNAFTVDEARRILQAARAHGLRPKVHADQFRDGGGAALAAEVGAISAEHLDGTGEEGMRRLREAGVVPVLLPASCLFLGLPRPDARRMIDRGLPVALATDFNPGSSPTENLSLVAALACAELGMTPEEALAGITRNAAAAIGLEAEAGRIAVGRRADLVILDAPSYVHVAYRLGTNLVRSVVVDGKIAVDRGRIVGQGRRR